MQPKPPRPTGVTILAVLAILGALALLFSGAVLIGAGLLVGTLATQADINRALANAGYTGLESLTVGTISALLLALGVIVLLLGILYLMVGVGFLGGRSWAWSLGIIVSAVSIVLDIVQVAFGNYSNVVGVIIGLLIIYYLMRPQVKVFFGKGTVMAPAMSSPRPSP